MPCIDVYKTDGPVGKSTDQVGRNNEGGFLSKDSEVYSKWSQANSSAQALVDRALDEGEKGELRAYFTLVLPVLVVPDGTLWDVHFDRFGKRVREPQQTKQCSFFQDIAYTAGERWESIPYHVSHLEFMTVSGLRSYIDAYVRKECTYKLFPEDILAQKAEELQCR